MKKLILGLALGAAALASVAGPALTSGLTGYGMPGSATNPYPGNQPQNIGDLNNLINAINSVLALGAANSAVGPSLNPSGRVYTQLGPTTALATGQGVTIATYTIPYNAFDVPYRTIRVVADFHSGANFAAKWAGCGFGTKIVTATVASTDNSGIGRCELTIANSLTSNTVEVTGRLIWSGSTTANYSFQAPGTVALSTTQSYPVYFEVAPVSNANDEVLDNFSVYYDD